MKFVGATSKIKFTAALGVGILALSILFSSVRFQIDCSYRFKVIYPKFQEKTSEMYKKSLENFVSEVYRQKILSPNSVIELQDLLRANDYRKVYKSPSFYRIITRYWLILLQRLSLLDYNHLVAYYD